MTPVLLLAQNDYAKFEDLADANGRFITVENTQLYYVAEGSPANPAILLIHGFGGSTFTWRDNMLPLADAGYYAIALDLPPFGLSEKAADTGYSPEDYTKYIAGLMDMLEVHTATIVGHSMGGNVAAQFALTYPERIDKLVLISAAIFSEDEATAEQRGEDSTFSFLNSIDPNNPDAVQLLRNVLRPSNFAALLSSAYYDAEFVTEDMKAGYARPLLTETWPQGFLGYLATDQSTRPTLEDLTALRDLPTLIIWGEEDTWVPIATGEALSQAILDAHFIHYEQVGHLPMEEATDAFNRDVIAFLAGR